MVKATSLGMGIVLAIAIRAAGAEEKPVPEIWKDIVREATATIRAAEEGGDDWGALRRRRAAPARGLAERYGRSAIETLVRNPPDPKWLPTNDLGIEGSFLSAFVMIEVADPKGKNGLKVHDAGPGICFSWYGVAAAAIDVYHDDRARDLLLEIALGEHKVEYWNGAGGGVSYWVSPAVYALGFLRTYDPEVVRPRIEGALRAEEGKQKLYLQATLSSFDYAASLDPSDRKRYQDFERRLWRARGLSGRGFRGLSMEFQHAAKILDKHWKEGDERFLQRIFEDPTATPDERLIAGYLVHRLPEDVRKKLDANKRRPE